MDFPWCTTLVTFHRFLYVVFELVTLLIFSSDIFKLPYFLGNYLGKFCFGNILSLVLIRSTFLHHLYLLIYSLSVTNHLLSYIDQIFNADRGPDTALDFSERDTVPGFKEAKILGWLYISNKQEQNSGKCTVTLHLKLSVVTAERCCRLATWRCQTKVFIEEMAGLKSFERRGICQVVTRGKINCILKSNNFGEGFFLFYIISCPVISILSHSVSQKDHFSPFFPYLQLLSPYLLPPKFIQLYPHGTRSNTHFPT